MGKALEPTRVEMEIETKEWLNTVIHFGSLFFRVAGSVKSILKDSQLTGQKWLTGRTSVQTAID